MIWNKNACADVQTGTELLKGVGVNLNPDEPIVTQFDELSMSNIKGTPVNRF